MYKRQYLDGQLGYAINKNETKRSLTFGGLKHTAKGSYDSTHHIVRVGGGVPFHLGGAAYLTATGALAYTGLSADSYTETGADVFNVKVNPGNVSALVASVGGKVHTRVETGSGVLIPSATLGASYDMIGKQAEASGTYQTGGASFKVKGASVQKLSGIIGFGLRYETGIYSVGVSYDGSFKSGYSSHAGMLEARVKF